MASARFNVLINPPSHAALPQVFHQPDPLWARKDHALCAKLQDLPRGSKRSEHCPKHNDSHQGQDGTDDADHNNIEITLTMGCPATRKQGYDRTVVGQNIERTGPDHSDAMHQRRTEAGFCRDGHISLAEGNSLTSLPPKNEICDDGMKGDSRKATFQKIPSSARRAERSARTCIWYRSEFSWLPCLPARSGQTSCRSIRRRSSRAREPARSSLDAPLVPR